MKFLWDVHISLKASKRLEQLGHESIHVNHILNKWHTKDEEIIQYVDKNDFILISKGQDFRDSFLLGSKPKKLVKISLGNISNHELLEIIERELATIHSMDGEYKKFMIEVYISTSTIITKD